MKKFELFFTFFQLPVDYLMLVLAGASAYALRFSSFITGIRPVMFNFNLTWNKYWPILIMVALGWQVIFALSGLYSADPNRKLVNDFNRIILACSTGFAGITIYVFFTLQKFDSRFLVLASWILAILYVSAGRILIRALKNLMYRLGFGLRRTIIIGQERIAEIIQDALTIKPQLGCKVSGVYEHFDESTLASILQKKPDEIIFTDPKARAEETFEAIDFANEHNIIFKYSADLFDTISTNMAVSTIAGIPIIELRRTRLTGWGRIIKGMTDIFFSIILIIIFSPFLLIISFIIFLETGRPIIYKNKRVGQNGETFFILKFRSMYQQYCTGEQFGETGEEALKTEEKLIATNNVKVGPVYKIKDDPRLTPFGRFIRIWSLDEIPQFWNVLKGEMSLVGPRPHQPREVAHYGKRHKILLAIKPGITGLAQISGRSNLTFEEEVKLDTFYIENWHLLLDLIILVKTPFIVLKRRGAW